VLTDDGRLYGNRNASPTTCVSTVDGREYGRITGRS
jgi:hypothetical protein